MELYIIGLYLVLVVLIYFIIASFMAREDFWFYKNSTATPASDECIIRDGYLVCKKSGIFPTWFYPTYYYPYLYPYLFPHYYRGNKYGGRWGRHYRNRKH